MKTQILEFFNSRKTDAAIKLNDFLKSLYPKVTVDKPAMYLMQAESKKIAGVLTELVNEGHFTIQGNQHKLLGKPYYEGEDQRQRHYTINNLELIAEK